MASGLMYCDILGMSIATYSVCRFFKAENIFLDKETILLVDKFHRKKELSNQCDGVLGH